MALGLSDSALLVPPSRLGRVLRDQRHALERSISEVSDSSLLSEALLEDAEQGRARLDDAILEELASAYEIDVQRLAPQRAELVIDLEEGWLSVSEQHMVSEQPIAVNEPDVLTRYLALVYALREIPAGTPVPLRDLDVAVLSHALDIDRDDVAGELTGLMTTGSRTVEATASTLRERIIVPLAGILVGITAIGGLVLVRPEPAVTVGDDIPVDIGDAVMIANPNALQIER